MLDSADSGTLLGFGLELCVPTSSAPRNLSVPTEAVVAVAPAVANAR